MITIAFKMMVERLKKIFARLRIVHKNEDYSWARKQVLGIAKLGGKLVL